MISLKKAVFIFGVAASLSASSLVFATPGTAQCSAMYRACLEDPYGNGAEACVYLETFCSGVPITPVK